MKKLKLTVTDLNSIAAFNKIIMNYLKMKRIQAALILIIALIWCSPCFGQQQKVVYPAYISFYNPDTKIPDSVFWISEPHIKVADREPGFHATGNRPNETKDYAHSGYDIGHNANASDLNGNKQDEYDSFDFANAFPQRPNCNRLVWLQLENHVRDLANQYGQVKNKVYWLGISGHIGKDRVTIPTLCVKEIWYAGKHEKYVVPNCDTVNKHDYTFYRINLK